MYKNIALLLTIFLFLGLFCSKKLSSQNVLTETERNYNLSVKQFNEFIDRFNYKTDFKGNTIDSEFTAKISRKKYLELLFNKEDDRLNKKSKSFNPYYIDSKNDFINDVVANKISINKYSLKIVAEAKSLITYNNKTQEISVFLNQEIVDDGVKWVILAVKAGFLNVLQSDTSLLRFIPPTSNETNFISLKRVADDKSFQHYYAYNGFTYDPLSAFLFALNTDLVKFQYVNEIIYHIYDIDGWIVQVKEFNRNTENSGWLINDTYKVELSFDELLEELIKY